MVSRVHSSSDLMRGLSHILDDSMKNLPDDLAELEDLRRFQDFVPYDS